MAYLVVWLLAATTPLPPVHAAIPPADPAAVVSIRMGHHDCPHCMLANADLNNTCVKNGNLAGADFDGANLTLMCMSYANFSGASFRRANLSGANLAHADLDGADFTDAKLTITSFKGTDLRGVKGMTQAQLDTACSDAATKAPAGMHVNICS